MDTKDSKKLNAPQKEFLELQTKELQTIYEAYKEIVSSDEFAAQQTPEDQTAYIKETLAQKLSSSFSFTPTVAERIAAHILDLFPQVQDIETQYIINTDTDIDANTATQPTTPTIFITLKDYERFIEKIQLANTPPTEQLKSLLFSFMVFYRDNYHPTGWVRYDRKNIFYLAGLSSLSTQKQEKLVNKLHDHFGLDMRVVGSNQPIPCFKINWLYDQDDVSTPKNPLLSFGPFTPKNLKQIITKANNTMEDIQQ